jgi:hypothetical protein
MLTVFSGVEKAFDGATVATAILYALAVIDLIGSAVLLKLKLVKAGCNDLVSEAFTSIPVSALVT